MKKSKAALSLTLSAALIASMAGLAGCGNTNDGNTTKAHNISTKNNGRIGKSHVLNNRNDRSGMQQHDLSNLKYSRVLSNKISKVKGVGNAHVFVSKNNAYVALSLDNQKNTGTSNMNPGNGMDGRTNTMSNRGRIGGMGTNGRSDGLYGASGTGSAGLLRGMSDPRGNLDNNTGLGRSAGYGSYGSSRYNTMGDNSGDNGIMGNNGATIGNRGRYGTLNNNAGTDMNNENSVPSDIREMINSKIQKTVPNCDQVYVSADSGFYDHSAGYANDNTGNVTGTNANRDGNIVGNMTEDLGAFINRIFPLGRGNGIMHNSTNRDGMFNDNNNMLNNNRANR
ncbi:YhcN/YlaJ family sporulation lipoprotein [Paenibacillus lemnae]|uniref:Sporulation protein n=1 Tax=Paenibacillus lemnae TaxID=1330551 RepID=A0A848M6L9_PAELE|nr:YhcN/YlaJ family sporulation lipoprotein [Paenibacillus lemnae]NMO95244.1 sporulation protein [Paenibacillus lemnae]